MRFVFLPVAGLLAGRFDVSEVTPAPALIGSADVWLSEGTRFTSPICLPPALHRVGREVFHLTGTLSACAGHFRPAT